jgi:hypothetical protein
LERGVSSLIFIIKKHIFLRNYLYSHLMPILSDPNITFYIF